MAAAASTLTIGQKQALRLYGPEFVISGQTSTSNTEMLKLLEVNNMNGAQLLATTRLHSFFSGLTRDSLQTLRLMIIANAKRDELLTSNFINWVINKILPAHNSPSTDLLTPKLIKFLRKYHDGS